MRGISFQHHEVSVHLPPRTDPPSLPPPAKRRRGHNGPFCPEARCAAARSVSPTRSHFISRALVPPVLAVSPPLQPSSGLEGGGFSLFPCGHQAQFHRSAHHMFPPQIKKIKTQLLQPGSSPRAQLKTQNKEQNINLNQGPSSGSVPPPLQLPSPPEEGAVAPLYSRAERWQAAAVHPWVLKTVLRGYRLQFASRPPKFNGVLVSVASGDSAQVLEGEISSLLSKGAIRVVPEGEIQEGFYSRYFTVPKRGGGLRPILDLRVLNSYLRKYKFRMLTLTVLSRAIRPDDWFTSIDLQDAYFHIHIYPAHRKFLRFAYQGIAYEYMTLPFGLSLAPRVFTKCVEAALNPLRDSGLRIHSYIDDYLLCSHSEALSARDSATLLTHLTDLGFRINYTKSCLTLTQRIEYLGIMIDSVRYRATLTDRRREKFHLCLSLFREGRTVAFRTCLSLLGLMASLLAVVPLGLLRMRDFQRWVSALRLCPRRHRFRPVTVTASCLAALGQWRDPALLSQGAPLGSVSQRKVITSDSSLTGWGAVHEGRSVNGTWPIRLRRAHINYLELLAVFLALKHFLPFLQGSHVLVRSDNSTTVAYINRQGGTRSLRLHKLAHSIIIWSSAHFPSLRATHVPGRLNTGADLLSRGNPVYGEWVLNRQVVRQVWERYGQASVDLFASRANAQCPLFFSLAHDDAPLGVDALAHPWPNALLYAFPPLCLISPTLERAREQRLSIILIAPRWPEKHWLAEIIQLLSAQPWPLPLRRDLLSQANGEIFHPHPERMALWAWPVRG